MNSYDVIVGSNNETGELELDRIISITSKYYDEYMVNPGVISVNNGGREGLFNYDNAPSLARRVVANDFVPERRKWCEDFDEKYRHLIY